ncbi:MAG: RodZ domain-containing protein [Vulcanimicrobiaceae bacterium]
MSALGDRFRAARENRGLSLSEVSEQIRIRSVYLAAIEDENWAVIGAAVYVRGFLRTYARFLGLDPEQAVSEFAGREPEPIAPSRPDEPPAESPLRAPGSGLGPFIWVASLVAVVLIALIVYLGLTLQQGPVPVAAVTATPGLALTGQPSSPPTGQPSSSPAGLLPTGSATAHTLVLHLSAPSWLRVTVDGNVSMVGTFPAGTTRTFHGKVARVRIGNAGGVTIYVDGAGVGPLGKSGDVVVRRFTL